MFKLVWRKVVEILFSYLPMHNKNLNKCDEYLSFFLSFFVWSFYSHEERVSNNESILSRQLGFGAVFRFIMSNSGSLRDLSMNKCLTPSRPT